MDGNSIGGAWASKICTSCPILLDRKSWKEADAYPPPLSLSYPVLPPLANLTFHSLRVEDTPLDTTTTPMADDHLLLGINLPV
ncbi:hypothetical protein N7509_011752 [Penicillium cosmopolitanum]|uniref:Uncharacterized protein n=1 Tax=Penicillium cosmopolitanum TaxID=1131564 RepID=A0A9W9SHD8_9EURO|nr:uncharacterized protein N7509_011752 [Penicillium cosmopolitanum]KAJ5378633.1 hypothetical protein N7509_011752 [Penicillium cosmopolitanum]